MARAPSFVDVLSKPPFVLRWDAADNPFPVHTIHSLPARRRPHPLLAAPPWLHTGNRNQAFDVSHAIRLLSSDIVAHCEELAHIDTSRLLFAVTQARNAHTHGLQARVTPFRFPGGSMTCQRRGVVYQVQRFFDGDVEFLYLITFCLPRFLNQSFDDKLVTLFHELFHISPKFDGDLRRYEGRYCLHTHSQRSYDEKMTELARSYLSSKPSKHLLDFFRLNFAQLELRHGQVTGIVVPRPKILPILRRRKIG